MLNHLGVCPFHFLSDGSLMNLRALARWGSPFWRGPLGLLRLGPFIKTFALDVMRICGPDPSSGLPLWMALESAASEALSLGLF